MLRAIASGCAFSALSICVVASVLTATRCSAATIVKPTAVTASSSVSSRPAVGSIDGTGLSSDLLTGDPIPVTFPSHDTPSQTPAGQWATDGNNDLTPWIVFDLGAVYDLTGFHVWNFNQTSFTNLGIRNVTATFSTTSAVAGFSSPELFAGANEFAQAPALTTYQGQNQSFATTHTARWVRFDNITNWGNGTFRAGLAEIRFFHEPFVAPPVAAVPEPASASLIALGSLLAVRGARRRRRLARVA